MTAPVDVLAVMGIAATTLHAENYSGTANSMDAARAAVAELIGVAELAATINILHETSWGPGPCRCSQCQLITKAKSSLARVKGGAA